MALTGEERKILAAAAERILPSDDGPGAAETGAAAYIERLLETDGFRSWQPLFEDGLGRFEELAEELFALPFPSCDADQRDEVLRRFQAEPDRLRRAFFRKLVSFTLEGFLCDPAHGGNRGGLGWSYLGVPEVHTGHCLGKTGE
ncbi:MAG TPA: gluconate 2-dehydrogenase subunit 3 family protein [Thermoanaerobaculia bacterium]|nr:gluconate 2-dehydrogenase subunit 3 family protein [Thermoanaerobaculia bacterium]